MDTDTRTAQSGQHGGLGPWGRFSEGPLCSLRKKWLGVGHDKGWGTVFRAEGTAQAKAWR